MHIVSHYSKKGIIWYSCALCREKTGIIPVGRFLCTIRRVRRTNRQWRSIDFLYKFFFFYFTELKELTGLYGIWKRPTSNTSEGEFANESRPPFLYPPISILLPIFAFRCCRSNSTKYECIVEKTRLNIKENPARSSCYIICDQSLHVKGCLLPPLLIADMGRVESGRAVLSVCSASRFYIVMILLFWLWMILDFDEVQGFYLIPFPCFVF